MFHLFTRAVRSNALANLSPLVFLSNSPSLHYCASASLPPAASVYALTFLSSSIPLSRLRLMFVFSLPVALGLFRRLAMSA